MAKYNKDNTLILSERMLKRFLQKIKIPKDRSQCWMWTSSTNGKYGAFSTSGYCSKFPHRIMYELIKGKIKIGLVIDHLCSNGLCTNPDHLEEVSYSENLKRGSTDLQHNGFCINGHKRTTDNVYVTPSNGGTRCRKCKGVYHPEREDYVTNKDKTHCKRGHEFNVDNTYIRPNDNGRQCKICDNLRRDGKI